MAKHVRPDVEPPRVRKVDLGEPDGLCRLQEIVRQQIEGGIVQGLSMALHEQVTYRAGGAVESNFPDYRILRMSETPEMSVKLLSTDNAVSGVAEIGLMQIKPATARMMGYAGSTAGLFDPETNIKYGMKYLAKAQKLGDGTTCGTILKYNAGHAAKRMNPVSLNYCGKVKLHLAGV